MITADNITDEQIRELMDWAGEQPNKRRLFKTCLIALFGAEAKDLRRGETRQVARARCAQILNARSGK